MKVYIKYESPELKKNKNFVEKFINLLQKEYPLKTNLKIIFLNDRNVRYQKARQKKQRWK